MEELESKLASIRSNSKQQYKNYLLEIKEIESMQNNVRNKTETYVSWKKYFHQNSSMSE